jgi:hypothetical protein
VSVVLPAALRAMFADPFVTGNYSLATAALKMDETGQKVGPWQTPGGAKAQAERAFPAPSFGFQSIPMPRPTGALKP